jgi:RNA polymerase sigma-70 factor (ECF subfamily)
MQLSFNNSTPFGSALLDAFRRGEDWAFRKIFARYRIPILRYASERVSNRETAEELSQEVFLKAFRARESYQPVFPFSAWLRTIARNTIIDWFRKGTPPSALPEAVPDELPSQEANAEALLVKAADSQRLKHFFGSLTGHQRKVLQLRLLERLSYGEIARQLGLSLSAVKCLIYRSKRAIKDLPTSRPV